MDTILLSTGEISVEHLSEIANFAQNNCHDYYEIIYVISGEGKYALEGREFNLCERTLVLSRPLAYHTIHSVSIPFEAYALRFSQSSLPAESLLMLERLIADDENGRYFTPDLISDSLVSAIDRFETANRLPKPEKEAYCRALLSEIIILLSAASGEGMTFSDDELGARVIRYLNSNIEKNISLDKLARRFFVSKFHLCRAFKKYSGISVHSYINHKRITYAKQLIESGETAQSAAFRVGFGDYSAFYRAYVKIIGHSPRAESIGGENK